MSEAALFGAKQNRTQTANLGLMSDEQLSLLRAIFQTIDASNNGSITPALLAEFYQDEGVNMDLRAVEDLFDNLGAEHSLPFRRFLVYAEAICSKLPSNSKWKAAGSQNAVQKLNSHQDGQREIVEVSNHQILQEQAKLERIQQEIADGQATLIALNEQIQRAKEQLESIQCEISDRQLELGTYNLVQPVRRQNSNPSNETNRSSVSEDTEVENEPSTQSESDVPVESKITRDGADQQQAEESLSSESDSDTPDEPSSDSKDKSGSAEQQVATEESEPQENENEQQPQEASEPVDESEPSTKPNISEPTDTEEVNAPSDDSSKQEKRKSKKREKSSKDIKVDAIISQEAKDSPTKQPKHSPSKTPDKEDKVKSKKKKDKKEKDGKVREPKEPVREAKEPDSKRLKEKQKSMKKVKSTNALSPNAITKTKAPRPDFNADATEDVMNASASGKDPLRSPRPGTPIRSPRTMAPVPLEAALLQEIEPELTGETLALIDDLFFVSVDAKLQSIIDGLQPIHSMLDLSYFNLVVHIQGLNTQLMSVAIRLPTVSSVSQPQSARSRLTVQSMPSARALSSKSSVIGMPVVSVSASAPTPPVTKHVKIPATGSTVTGPFFSIATGELLNSLGSALVQCTNSLLLLIQDAQSKSPNVLNSLCSSWKASLYHTICNAYHAIRNLIRGTSSDMAQYFFPAESASAEEAHIPRPLTSAFNSIILPPTNVNDDYMPDSFALKLMRQHQLEDIQLLTRQEFVQLFDVYFGSAITEKLFYILDPWNTESIPVKRFAELLRNYGSVVGASCYKNFYSLTETPGFQGYLTEGVVLSILEHQSPGTFCLWFNKIRPKFSVLQLSWLDEIKEVVSTVPITISPPASFVEGAKWTFAVDLKGSVVSAQSLPELLAQLKAMEDFIQEPYTPQFPRSSVFHGDLESPEAETLLAGEVDGTLLFRLSSRKGSLAVSYVFRGKVGHTLLKITMPDCYEYSGQVYNGINEVIQGHAQIFKYIFDNSKLARHPDATPSVYL